MKGKMICTYKLFPTITSLQLVFYSGSAESFALESQKDKLLDSSLQLHSQELCKANNQMVFF